MRVIGAFAVMMLHVAAQNWYTTDVKSLEWLVINFYDSGAVRWAVPVFVMISGALFLDRDIPIRKIYSKYIFRILTALLFWSFIFAAKDFVKTGDIIKASAHFIRGHFHLWFLFMIIGLYMIVPFVRDIAKSEAKTKYFLILALIFTSIMPQAVNIILLFSEKYSSFAGKFLNGFYMHFVMGFTGYYLLGHFLNKAEISHKTEYIIYSAGLCGFAVTVLLSSFVSIITGEPNGTFYSGIKMNLNTVCESAAVFVLFKQHFNYEVKFIRKLSQYSFGAYLVHPAVISLINKLGLNSLTFNPLFSIPVIAVIVFIVSFIISAVINNIPVLRKYIV